MAPTSHPERALLVFPRRRTEWLFGLEMIALELRGTDVKTHFPCRVFNGGILWRRLGVVRVRLPA